MVKNDEKLDEKGKNVVMGGGGGGGWFLSNVWKNVGMTVTCSKCDVTPITRHFLTNIPENLQIVYLYYNK